MAVNYVVSKGTVFDDTVDDCWMRQEEFQRLVHYGTATSSELKLTRYQLDHARSEDLVLFLA